jgi:hypothetical protein
MAYALLDDAYAYSQNVMNHAQVTAAICGPSRRAEYLGLARQALTIELDESARTKIGSWFE